jgi:hypothetical protein
MAGLTLNASNIISVLATLYPLFIVSFIILVSIFNLTVVKGIVYFSGVIILWLCCGGLKTIWRGYKKGERSSSCDFIFTSFNKYTIPRFDVALTFYTFIYLVLPMFLTKNQNWAVISFLLASSIGHMIHDSMRGCSTPPGIFIGLLSGLGFGSAWFSAFWYSNNKHLLFYNELLSNNVVCNKPSNQKFKCHVYKNGEILSDFVTNNTSFIPLSNTATGE